MDFSNIPWIAVAVAIVANMVLGFLWYGPIFGKAWMAAVGKQMDELNQSPTIYIVPILASGLIAVVVWNVMGALDLSGVITAFWMWLGFIALTSYTNHLFRGGPTNLWELESGNHLVGMLITGLILDLMG